MEGLTKDMSMGEILSVKPEVVPILLSVGMHCVSCPAHVGETLEEAAMVHGIDIDDLMEYIEKSLAAGENGEA